MTNKEIWKPIKGYEGLYEISNFGNVKTFNYKNMGITRNLPEIDTFGYSRVALTKLGITKRYLIHKLVAQEFIPNPNKHPQINHKDEDTTNNNVGNLEWCTAKYNTNYGTCIYRRSRSRMREIIQYDLDMNFIKMWNSGVEASESGFNRHHISSCCNGKRKTHGGYIWRLKEMEDNND